MKPYEEFGCVPQRRHLGQPVVYGATETGDVNSYVHIWIYKDATDWAAKHAEMAADPERQEFLKRSAEADNLVSQINKIRTPASFFEPPTQPE